jgi:hypothetical protein
MKKTILIVLSIFVSTILQAQEGDTLFHVRTPIYDARYFKSNKDPLYQNVQTLQQFVINVTVSYQMYAKKIKEDRYLKPGIILNNKPVSIDSLKAISWDKIKSLEFRTGKQKKIELFSSIKARSGIFFIETK